MKNTPHILLFGAGKSATVLIRYLAKIATEKQWLCTVADMDMATILAKTGGNTAVKAVALQIDDEIARKNLIAEADIVISLLPPALHFLVAKDCLQFRKHLLTASYIDDNIEQLRPQIEAADLLFLGEMGLDPGIDHMSAMQLIDDIHAQGGVIQQFKSHCGGLVAPESDDNPWHYKISWNPRNIVTAGKAGAIYKMNNEIVEKDYQSIFSSTGFVNIEGLGELAYYPNRDSLAYISLYQLESAHTFIRATLRHPDFCKAWQKIVAAGLTNDDEMVDSNKFSYAGLVEMKLHQHGLLLDTDFMKYQFHWLALRDYRCMNKGMQPVSTVFQHLLEDKLKLNKSDKDMIVMLHEISYTLNGKEHQLNSSLVVKGDDEQNTAMAKTVGLPLGIAATLLLENKLPIRGLHIPVKAAIYEPVLEKLEQEGIRFREIKN